MYLSGKELLKHTLLLSQPYNGITQNAVQKVTVFTDFQSMTNSVFHAWKPLHEMLEKQIDLKVLHDISCMESMLFESHDKGYFPIN